MRKSKNKTKWESYYFNRVVLQVLDIAPLQDTRHFPSNIPGPGIKTKKAPGNPMELAGETLILTVVLN